MPPSPKKPISPERLRAERAGRRAEALAALFLQVQLYRIVERRLKTPVGEIDLIVERFGPAPAMKARHCSRSTSGASFAPPNIISPVTRHWPRPRCAST
jgi:putative endonuclease